MNERTKVIVIYICAMVAFPYIVQYTITYLASNGTIPQFSNEQITMLTNLFINVFLPIILILIIRKAFIDDSKKLKNLLGLILPGIILLYGASTLAANIALIIDGTALTSNQNAISQMQDTSFIMTMLMVIILQPVSEEIVFRYAFLSNTPGKSMIPYIIASSLCFGLVHQISGFTIGSFAAYSFVGLVFALYYVKKGNIVFNILIHGGYNLLTYLLLYASKNGMLG